MFAIYVSYYVKVKLTLSGMGGELSLKLPFTLAHFDERCARDEGHPTTPSTLLTLHQQESIATDEDTNDNACDTPAKSTNSSSTTATLPKKPVTIMAAVESHQNNNHNSHATLIDYRNNYASCSSSSSSGKPPPPTPKPLSTSPSTTGSKDQVSHDSDGDEDDRDMVAPSLSALRQRRFSQVRQERIRPEEDSLDRIETLSDDGDVDLEGHEMVLVEEDGEDDNGNSRLVDKETGIGLQANVQRPKPERKLTGSSASLDETELLDEVFCDTLMIGQQQQQHSKVQLSTAGPQGSGSGYRGPHSSTKTSSSISKLSSSSTVVRGSSGGHVTGCPIGNAQQQQQDMQERTNSTEVHGQVNETSSTSTTSVQIHAPQSS